MALSDNMENEGWRQRLRRVLEEDVDHLSSLEQEIGYP